MAIRIRKLVESSNLREVVYKILKKAIIFGKIPPGKKIDEEDLAKRLGVSRTPIRESLCRLENEGIVKIIPRRGAFAVKHSKQRVVEILLLRETLEGFAARLAVDHIDKQTIEEMKSFFKDFSKSTIPGRSGEYIQADLKFHTLIHKKSKNSLLMSLMNTLNDHIQMLRLRTVSLKGRLEHSLQEHLRIIEALENKNRSLAESLMRKHIQNVRESLLRNLDED